MDIMKTLRVRKRQICSFTWTVNGLQPSEIYVPLRKNRSQRTCRNWRKYFVEASVFEGELRWWRKSGDP